MSPLHLCLSHSKPLVFPLVLGFALAIGVAGASSTAHAYDCTDYTPQEAWNNVSEVFEARVVRTTRTRRDPNGTVTVRVLRVYKGTTRVNRTVTLHATGYDGLPAVGSVFVATANRHRGRIYIAICADLDRADAAALAGQTP